MRFLFIAFFFALICFTTKSRAAVDTKIHSIDYGELVSDDVLVFFTSGTVSRLAPSETELLTALQKAFDKDAWVSIAVNESGKLLSVRETLLLSPVYKKRTEKSLSLNSDYIPSVLPNYDVARNLFLQMRKPLTEETECWQRAHIWAYDWRTSEKLFTSKIWIFFTRKYLRQNPDFTWWFHVAPLVHVNMEGVIKERVMDKRYGAGPQMIKRWSDTFMRDRAHCPVVDSYSNHDLNQDSVSCFIQKSSMYYLQPADLERLEKLGISRDMWVESEVITAYDKAFGIKIQGEKP